MSIQQIEVPDGWIGVFPAKLLGWRLGVHFEREMLGGGGSRIGEFGGGGARGSEKKSPDLKSA